MKVKAEQKNIKISTVFDWVKHINNFKTPVDKFTEEEWKKFEPYLIHRIISMDPDLVELCDYVQRQNFQDKKRIYLVYKELIPKNSKWNTYIKSKTKSLNKDLVKLLSKYFVCSNRESTDYLELLSKNEIKNILISMGVDEKETKKLLR